jgi:hypothetical protein
MGFDEMDVTGACARRFDGYRYIGDTGFNVAEAVTSYFESGIWNVTETEQLAVFFLLQRGFNWGLAREPRDGMYFKAFRELFLVVAERDVPEAYRLHPCYKEWQGKYVPHLAEYIERIRRIHRGTRYVVATTLRAADVFPPPSR